MKPDCMRVENAIWDCVLDGTDVPGDILGHARSCPDCSRVLEEAKLSLKLLQCAAPYPEAPDCREAVLARIAGRKRVPWARRFAWAAAPLTALIVAAAFILPMRPSQGPEPVRIAETVWGTKSPPHVSKTDYRSTEVGKPLPQKPKVAQPERPAVRKPKAVQPERVRPLRRPVRDIDMIAARPETYGRYKELAVLPDSAETRLVSKYFDDSTSDWSDMSLGYYFGDYDGADSPDVLVAAVSVEWSAEPRTENLSYQFTEEDAATGTVTTGSVERSGNNIEIIMESTSAESDSPERGELSNEKKPAA